MKSQTPFPTFQLGGKVPEVSKVNLIRLLENAFPQATFTVDDPAAKDMLLCHIQHESSSSSIAIILGAPPQLCHTSLGNHWFNLDNWNDALGWVACIRENIGDPEQDKWLWSKTPGGIIKLPNLCRLCWEEPDQDSIGLFSAVHLSGARYTTTQKDSLRIVFLRPGDMDFPVAQIFGSCGIFVPEHAMLVEINIKAGAELQWDRKLLRVFLKKAQEGKVVKAIQVSHDVFTSLRAHFSEPVAAPFNFYGVSVYVCPTLPAGSVIYS